MQDLALSWEVRSPGFRSSALPRRFTAFGRAPGERSLRHDSPRSRARPAKGQDLASGLLSVSDQDRELGSKSGIPAMPGSVVLPTIGRPELIRACLDSLAACEPRAEEIIIVDSSHNEAVAEVAADFATAGARRIQCRTLGIGEAFNLGLREARHEIVLLTNDDCTVEPSWVERGLSSASRDARTIVTGRVRPRGDPSVVPSTIDDPIRREYSGRAAFVLYTQSMALHRSVVLEFGGFDERIQPAAEDNDLSYRWLRAGRRILYEPDFAVWHHDWRSREQLERLYINYGVGQGMVYGKHLRRGDLLVTRYVAGAMVAGARGVVARVIRRHPEDHVDPRPGFLRGLPVGFVRGWRLGRDRS
jgi:Glycosyltransferase like family 2